MTTVQFWNLDQSDPAALYHHYPQEREPQSCFVSLDLATGLIAADWDGEIDSKVPEDVWHNRTLRWPIPLLTSEAANRLLGKLAPLAQKILDESAIEWNGQNSVGRLSADAQTAADEIEALCSDLDASFGRVVEWDVMEWIVDPPTVPPDADPDQLDQLAAQLRSEVQQCAENPQDHIVLWGLREHLENLRETARQAVEGGLVELAATIAKSVLRRNELIRAITWRPSREIADLADLSHTHVQRIAAKKTDPTDPEEQQ